MKKTLALLLALAMMLSVLAGCAKDPASDPADPTPSTPADPTPSTPSNPTPTPAPDPVVKTEPYGTFRDYSTTEITNINPHENADSAAGDLFMTLLRPYIQIPTADGTAFEYVGELAAELPKALNAEQTEWEIKIRQGLKWEDGTPITAEDIIYSYEKCLNPKLNTRRGASLASNYVTIKGANEYYTGKGEWANVGIIKVDDYTVKIVTTEFVSQTDVIQHLESKWCCIIPKDIFEANLNADGTSNTIGTSLDKWKSCGAFIMTEMVAGQHFTMVRNPDYPLADLIKVEAYNLRVVKDANTALELFLNGELDRVSLSAAAKEQYEDDPRVLMSPGSTVNTLSINHTNPNQNGLLGNLNFRRALFFAVDRATLAKMLSSIPANYILGQKCLGDPVTGTKYRDLPSSQEYLYDNYSYDPVKAKQYYDAALKELGLTTASVEFLYNESSANYRAVVEFLHSSLPKVFGDTFTVKLNAQTSAIVKTQRKAWTKGDLTASEIALSSWDTSSLCPWNALKVYCQWYSGRNEPIYNDEYDALWDQANNSKEAKIDHNLRIQLTNKAEKIALDEVFVVPLYETPSYQLCSERVTLPCSEYVAGFGWGWLYGTISK